MAACSQVDLATVMAEMYHVGDKDKNEKLELQEFIKGMLEHPVTSKIIRIKKIGKSTFLGDMT